MAKIICFFLPPPRVIRMENAYEIEVSLTRFAAKSFTHFLSGFFVAGVIRIGFMNAADGGYGFWSIKKRRGDLLRIFLSHRASSN